MVLCDITNVPKADAQSVRKQSDVGEGNSFKVRAGLRPCAGQVQRLGAHWDALRSRYYVPAGVGLAAFAEWREYPPKHGAST